MFSETEQSAINSSLEKILADKKFSGSPQMSAFLKYVVEEAIKGKEDRIKAYTVAVDALGKPYTFDPQNDPCVRVMAKRLRSSLNEYYECASGYERIIQMKPGSYRPIFINPAAVEPSPPVDKQIVDRATENTGSLAATELGLPGRNHAEARRTRPPMPTIMIKAKRIEDRVSASLVGSVRQAISKFDYLQLIEPTPSWEQVQKWPEDYELTIDALLMSDSKKIAITLSNSISGRVVDSDELLLHRDSAQYFTRADINSVEVFVARMVQKNGPLLSDYKSLSAMEGDSSTLSSCAQSQVESASDSVGDFNTDLKSNFGDYALTAELSLIEYDAANPLERKSKLLEAKTAARKNLELMPHSADSHALMMRVLQANGEYNTAFKHGEYALGINNLDSGNLLAFAVLLDDMQKPEQALEVRRMARSLTIKSSALLV